MKVALTFMSLFLRVRGSFLEPCPAVTVGRLPSLTVGSKVMSFAFSEGSFNESAEFDLDVTTAFLLSDLSLSKKKKKKKRDN